MAIRFAVGQLARIIDTHIIVQITKPRHERYFPQLHRHMWVYGVIVKNDATHERADSVECDMLEPIDPDDFFDHRANEVISWNDHRTIWKPAALKSSTTKPFSSPKK